MSINSDSVYIYNPPKIDSSSLNSSWNSFPWFLGFDFNADKTYDCWSAFNLAVEIIVIFSSLLNC